VETQRQPDLGAEVFSGYSGYRSGGIIDNVKLPDFKFGWAGQIILNINRRAGFVVNLGDHSNSSASAFDFSVGPRLQLPLGRFKPFVEASTGVQHFTPKNFPSQNTPTYTGGVGMDVKVNSSFSIRPFQLSLVSTSYTVLSPSNRPNYFNGYVAQAGVIYNLRRSSSQAEVFASCSAEPAAVDPGVNVKVHVTPKGFRHKRTLHYSYATTGGAISGSSPTESVDTMGVGPGTYTVTATVEDQGKGNHPQAASCQTQFSVNAQQPPPPPVEAKQPPPPPVEADRNARKSAEIPATPEAVQKPERLSATKPSRFGIIKFNRDVKRPTRVDNEAKGELDRYADALAAMPDATGVVVGYAGPKDSTSKYVLNVAALRAVNTKDYLAKQKGIDPKRIQPRSGGGHGQAAELWILPAAATFPAGDTKALDENKVKAVPRAPLKARKSHLNPPKDAHKNPHKTMHHVRKHKSSYNLSPPARLPHTVPAARQSGTRTEPA
jgi:outer membrane protein OmpA-like peptidoglycan-associated protein